MADLSIVLMCSTVVFRYLATAANVFWPYFAGASVFVLGLAMVNKNEVRQAQGIDRLIAFGPVFFATGMAIFGADHLTAAKFVATIVPSWMPGRLFWAYFVGVALIAAAVSLATRLRWQLAAAMLGIMIFLFVLMIHIPNVIATPQDKTRFTVLLRDLALSAGALGFAAWRNGQERDAEREMQNSRLGMLRHTILTLTRLVMAVSIAVFGVDQILNPTFAPGIPQEGVFFITMPEWIPAHVFWAYFSGTIFLICAAGLTTGKYAHSAATILGVTVLVLIALVYAPRMISRASDIAGGLNYVAIHFALCGAALLLARALPAEACEHARVANVKTSSASPLSNS
jgi:uncharacterized membrane protein